MLGLARVVLSKELVDGWRDRRSIAVVLLSQLMGPLALVAAMVSVASRHEAAQERPIELPVVGGEHAPELMRFLGQHNIVAVTAPADAQAAVRSGDRAAVLVIPASFGEKLRAGAPAPVQLVIDESRDTGAAVVARVRRLLETYGAMTGTLRLLARGVSPAVAEPLAIETIDVSTLQSRAGPFLAMLPMFVTVALLVGGFYIAVDATAGEKERQSLEPLLVNPVPRLALVLGKLGATVTFVAAGLIVELAAFGLLARFAPVESLGFAIRLGPGLLATIFVLLLPAAVFACALELLIGTRARGVRQAQATLSIVLLVPVLSMLWQTFAPVKMKAAYLLVPTLGESLVMNRLLRGEEVAGSDFGLVMVAELVYAGVLVALTVRALAAGRVLSTR